MDPKSAKISIRGRIIFSAPKFMNIQNTWCVCIVGFLVFSLGGFARQYMVVRLYGWNGYLSSQRNLTRKYRALVQGQSAPMWPIGVSLLCIPLGIAIVFAAILLSK
jgi:hypothetical protein